MISADHVRAKRRGAELTITQLKPKDRDEMILYAAQVIRLFKAGLHKRREELESQLDDMIVPSYLTRVAEGLKKMIFDRCSFGGSEELDVLALRAKVFALASQTRAELAEGEPFDRDQVLVRAAEELGVNVMHIDDDLFSDLKGAQRLKDFTAIEPQTLMSEYELAQEQAVLIRATELWVKVQCSDPAEYRYLFRQLKFRRLLCEITPSVPAEDGYEIHISGPHSIFKSSTKYGLQLALLLPALRRCRRWRLRAQVQWGKDKSLLDFRAEGARERPPEAEPQDLPEELSRLMRQLKKSKSQWRARRSSKIIHVPERGAICVPDLIFSHEEHSRRVYLELLGYWSREAVWRRVEWAEDIKERVIFAVSSRLRVSEEVLPEELPSALLVYKGAIVVSALVKLLDELVSAELLEDEPEPAYDADDADDADDAELAVETGASEGLDEELEDEAEAELSVSEDMSFSEDMSVSEELGDGPSAEPRIEVEPAHEEELIKASLSGVGLSEVGGQISLEDEHPRDQPSLFGDLEED